MRRRAGLKIITRKDTGTLWIVGTVIKGGPRIRQRAGSNNLKLAQEEAAVLQAQILRTAWHGEQRGTRTFVEAVKQYLASAPRSIGTQRRLIRLLRAIGDDLKLNEIDQAMVNRLAKLMLTPNAKPATLNRTIIAPFRAVLRYAHKYHHWCDPPVFVVPHESKELPNYLLPEEARKLIAAANPSLRILIEFILCTGARLSEALELEWRERDVDLGAARAIFRKTKNGKPRIANLPPRLVAILRSLPYREGAVIRRPDGQPYTDRNRERGGQVARAWDGAKRRAGINPALRIHDLRHTWASWYYAVHRDPIELKIEGGWSSIVQVERYAHLLPKGHVDEIEAFWHDTDTSADAYAFNSLILNEKMLHASVPKSDACLARRSGAWAQGLLER